MRRQASGVIVAGLDIGRVTDLTALVVMDERVVTDVHIVPSMSFAEQAAILAPLMTRLDLVAVDGTGMGLGLLELLRAAGLPVVNVIIGGGQAAPRLLRDGPGRGRPVRAISVGKIYMLGRLLGLVHAREITVAPWCCNRDELKAELGELTASFTRRGGLSIQARRGHDDLALALSLATLARDLAGQLLSRGDGDGAEDQGAAAGQRLEGRARGGQARQAGRQGRLAAGQGRRSPR
jgi:hypothetical protein